MSSSESLPIQRDLTPDAGSEGRDVWREATTMVLYVSVILLAELAVLPAGGEDDDGLVHGPHGWELVAIVWGTALGVTIAHWFAFRLAAVGFSAGRLSDRDLAIGKAEVAGAVFVAGLTSLPVLLFSDETEQRLVPFAPALTIGAVGYVLARTCGRSRLASLVLAGIALVIGVAVATVKYRLSGH